MSLDELTPIKPNYRGEASQPGKTRPDRPPQTQKSFQKLVSRDKPEADEDEVTVVDESDLEPTTSLFDLSAKKLKAAKAPPSLPSLLDSPIAKKPPIIDEGEETQIAVLPDEQTVGEQVSAFAKQTVSDVKQGTTDLTVGEQVSAFAQQVNRSPKDKPNLELTPQLPDDSTKKLTKLTDQPTTNTHPLEVAANTAKPKIPQNVEDSAVKEHIVSEDKPKLRKEALSLETDATVLASKKEKNKLTIREKNEFSQENPDISTLNPQLPQHAVITPARIAEEPKVPTQVDDIVKQMVEAMQVVKRENQTDTVVTLQYPPLFKVATITLTNLEGGGKREFNLSFANLKDDAKVFLDRKIIENSLVEILARNDITIHTLKTSTLPENALNLTPEAKYFAREEREQQRNQQQWENPEEQES
jgi:hypothetical protein